MNNPKNEPPKAANDSGPETPGPEGSDELVLGGGDIAREAAQIAALHEEVADLKDRYLRAVAETENVRRRAEREKVDAAQFAFQRFASDLLNVVDSFERAFDALKPEVRNALPQAASPVIEGLEVTQRELLSILERNRIRRIEAKGQRFNPNQHEAIAEVPSPDVPGGHVIDVVKPGYMIGERLLRPAMVVVSSRADGARNGSNGGRGSSLDTSA